MITLPENIEMEIVYPKGGMPSEIFEIAWSAEYGITRVRFRATRAGSWVEGWWRDGDPEHAFETYQALREAVAE